MSHDPYAGPIHPLDRWFPELLYPGQNPPYPIICDGKGRTIASLAMHPVQVDAKDDAVLMAQAPRLREALRALLHERTEDTENMAREALRRCNLSIERAIEDASND